MREAEENCSPPAVIHFETSLNVLVGHNGSHGSYLQTCLPFISVHTLQPPERERAVIPAVAVNDGAAAGLKQITCGWFYYVRSQRSRSLRTLPMKGEFNYVYYRVIDVCAEEDFCGDWSPRPGGTAPPPPHLWRWSQAVVVDVVVVVSKTQLDPYLMVLIIWK